MLRPRKVSAPCKSSIMAPRAVAIRNKPMSHLVFSKGRAHSQRKVNPPNITRCTHLSIKRISTLGSSLPGVKQPIKTSKVQSIARNLACFLYGESGENIRFIYQPICFPYAAASNKPFTSAALSIFTFTIQPLPYGSLLIYSGLSFRSGLTSVTVPLTGR